MFEMILFGLVCLCALVMLTCRFVFPALSKLDVEPWYLDYARSFFPVLLLVFLLRGFVAEPFRIPSGSMLPTLEVGDFILVNKFTYGIRLPIVHTKVLQLNRPQRGDIMVFRYPRDNKTSYIKRVIGLPGDTIRYVDKVLYINDQRIKSQLIGDYLSFGETEPEDRFLQTIETGQEDKKIVEFSTLLNPRVSGYKRGREWRVPEGHYFMMGDNRDNSSDGRSWGFVPDENIIGKAFFVWFHLNSKPGGGTKFSRVGTDIQAKTVQ